MVLIGRVADRENGESLIPSIRESCSIEFRQSLEAEIDTAVHRCHHSAIIIITLTE